MKKLSIMYCCFFALFVLNIFSQDLPKVMYVNSKDGLNQRNTPDLASEKVGTLLYGERIIVYEKSGNVTIDGITSCWYKTSKNSGGQCWVFGGYLSDEMPSGAAPVLGYWSTVRAAIYTGILHRGARSGQEKKKRMLASTGIGN